LGPTQAFSNFASNEDIKKALALLNQPGSKVVFGNLLTLPVGGGLMYVMPVYVQGSGNPYPLLRRVIVSFGDTVAFETSLTAALDQVFGPGSGTQVPPPPGTPSSTPPPSGMPSTSAPPGSGSAALADAVAAIQTALDHLQTATRTGDFAGIGSAQKELADAVARFETVSKNSATPSATAPTPTPTATR